MFNFWRIIPAVICAVMVLVWSVFSLVLVESSGLRGATNLGFTGATVRVIAIPGDGYGGPDRLTAALGGFVADHEVSVAYSRSYGTGLVTLLDERGRFRNSEGSLAALLGSGETAALATTVGRSAIGLAESQLPDGVELTGTFESDVMFEDAYPVALFSVESLPVGEGVYLFAGNHLSEPTVIDAVVRFFETNGMMVVDLMALDGATAGMTLAQNMAKPYGLIALMFAGIVVLAQLLVTLTYAALVRDRLLVTAVLGAATRHLRAIVLHRLLALVRSCDGCDE